MTTDAPSTTDPLAMSREWLAEISTGTIALDPVHARILQDLADEVASAREARRNMAEWLRARAEISLNQEDDPEQPGHEEFSKGWRAGSYNNLHLAANAIEDGRAALPRDRWPPYLRGEKIRPPCSEPATETPDVPTSSPQ